MNILNKIIVSPAFQKIVNRNQLSAFFGYLSNKHFPKFFLKYVINKYIKSYNISIEKYDFDINNVNTFNEFFTRKLKADSRKLSTGIISPADGIVGQKGAIISQQLYQVKGKEYTLKELLHEENTKLKSYITVYLSPVDYHRVHAPFDIQINRVKYIPGTLFSVSNKSIHSEDKVFCRNERIILFGDSSYGNFAIVLVGAIVVGKIKLSFEPKLVSNNKQKAETITYSAPINIKKADEIGYFEMGSTVILCTENESLNNNLIQQDEKIMFGEKIA